MCLSVWDGDSFCKRRAWPNGRRRQHQSNIKTGYPPYGVNKHFAENSSPITSSRCSQRPKPPCIEGVPIFSDELPILYRRYPWIYGGFPSELNLYLLRGDSSMNPKKVRLPSQHKGNTTTWNKSKTQSHEYGITLGLFTYSVSFRATKR